MPHGRSGVSARISALLGGLVALALGGCSDERSSAGPRAGDPIPPDVEVGENAPLDLSHVCGIASW